VRVRKVVAVSVVVLASLLLGALTSGTPVAGNDSVAALTAGIELGTAPVARAVTHATVERVGGLNAVALVLRTLLVLAAAAVVVLRRAATDHESSTRSLLVASGRTWRGPPT
jgi:hypothetical protein